MDAAIRDRVVWGLVGGLAFLVLGQGYVLVTSTTVSLWLLLAVAVVVTAVATGAAHLLETRGLG
jgi:hypothetical protein